MNVRDRIVALISSFGVWHGTDDLAQAIPTDPRETRRHLRQLDADGILIYRPTPGGRGHKSLIRKRNRNQPGLPRRVR